MRLTRKIPGIRLPFPGRSDEENPGGSALPVSVWFVVFFVLLLVGPLGHLRMVMPNDESMAVFWLEPRGAGFSNFTLFSIANLLFAVLVLGRFLTVGARRRRWAGKRLVVYAFVLALLGLNLVYLRGWKDTARHWLDQTLARHAEWDGWIEQVRAELAALDSHPWAGEYVGRREGWSITCWLCPERPNIVRWEGPLFRSDAPPLLRVQQRHYDRMELDLDGDHILTYEEVALSREESGPEDWSPSSPRTYVIVPWGERRYLIRLEAGERFWKAAQAAHADGGEVALVDGIFLRAGDESRPVEGLPTLPPEFAHLGR